MRWLAAAVLALSLTLPQSALAQANDYPNRPVTFIVPFAPGGVTGLFARLLGQKLEQRLGKPFIVEHRPGGGGVTAATAVARAEPDGYTIMMASSTILAAKPSPTDARHGGVHVRTVLRTTEGVVVCSFERKLLLKVGGGPQDHFALPPPPRDASEWQEQPAVPAALSLNPALAAEVVWTRALVVYVHNSTYAFSLMLGIFLIGLAVGDALLMRFYDRIERPLLWLGTVEVAIGVSVMVAALMYLPLRHVGSLSRETRRSACAPSARAFA